jgi:hypothetical protein
LKFITEDSPKIIEHFQFNRKDPLFPPGHRKVIQRKPSYGLLDQLVEMHIGVGFAKFL